ncbi:DUF805 domain-containing protein [Morganella morganii]
MFDYFLDGIRNSINFSGLANRPQFWYFQLASIIIGIVVGIFEFSIGTEVISDVLSLLFLLPGLSLGVRRLRDADFSPWLLLVIFVPFIGIITLIVLWCMPSKLSRPAQI